MSSNIERSPDQTPEAPKFLRSISLNYEIVGLENITKVRELLGSGKIIVAVLDHRSYADLTSGAIAAAKEGFADLVHSAYIVGNIKYVERFPTKQILSRLRLNFIPVVPHTLRNNPRRDEINQNAVEEAQNIPDGSILVVAPEGTRSMELAIQEARYGASQFWHGRGERYIVPVAIEGTEKQFRKGWLALPLYLLRRKTLHKAKFIFGEPVSVETLDRAAELFAQGDTELERRFKVSLVMNLIANLHIVHGDPEYAQGYYIDLRDELAHSQMGQALNKLGELGSSQK